MDIQHIRHVVTLVAQSHVAEVDITAGNSRIRVKNGSTPTSSLFWQVDSDTLTDPLAVVTTDPDHLDNTDGLMETSHTIRSTQIGRFQAAADAISDPAVRVGDSVTVGDTLGYVASLAQLLPIVSDKAGVVADILLDNGARVEYGTPVVVLH